MDKREERGVTKEDLELFITKQEMLEKEIAIRKDIKDSYDKSIEKVDDVESKVDHLHHLVLPLIESSKATAANTEKLVSSFDKFAERQEKITLRQHDTNSDIYERISNHDVELAKRQSKIESISKTGKNEIEKEKMKNSTKIAIITAIGTIIVALVSTSPMLAPIFFK